MRVKLVGACRGEARAYAKLAVTGAPAGAAWRAEAATSEGGRLPADVRPLPGDGAKRHLALTFPLFDCDAVTVTVRCAAAAENAREAAPVQRGGEEGQVAGSFRFTREGLARSSRANALVRPALCRELRGIEGRTPDPSGASIRFVQVFDDGEGGFVYRCHLTAAASVPLEEIVVRDGAGRAVDVPLRAVESWHRVGARRSTAGRAGGGAEGLAEADRAAADAAEGDAAGCEGCEAVVSLKADESLGFFSIELPGGAFAAMNPDLRGAFAGARDALMVNPGIDDRYRSMVAPPAPLAASGAAGDAAEAALKEAPLFSIVVPLYETPEAYLRDMIGSVLGQTHPSWELVLVNASPGNGAMRAVVDSCGDARVRCIELEDNLGIAGNTNAGIREARGSYLAFLDHDDMLEPEALAAYAAHIEAHPDVDVLYCDEDSFTNLDQPCFRPLLKPDANLSLLYSHDYFLHFLAVSRRVLGEVGCADEDSSGAQDYDLILKAIERARSVDHVAQVLYHWRVHAGSTNGGVMEGKPYAEAAAMRSLARHFARRGIEADVRDVDIPGVYRIDYRRAGRAARVSLVVLSSDETRVRELPAMRAEGPIREVVVVRKGSASGDASDAARPPQPCGSGRAACDAAPTAGEATVPGVRVVSAACAADAGFAEMANAGVQAASEDLVLVCGDAVSGDVADVAAQLAGCLAREEVGIVSPRLLYADGLVQHVGLCVREDGTIGYLNQNFATEMGGGYHGAAECSCDYSAVGPDCFMVRAADWRAAGGLSAYGGCAEIEIADLCFKLRARGLAATVLPDATLVNRDAVVIWPDRDLPFADPHSEELRRLWAAHDARFRRDALANPRVDLSSSYFRLR